MGDFLSSLLIQLDNQSVQENLAVLTANIFLSFTASFMFSATFGTPRSHSSIKLFSESMTRMQFALVSYYAYLIAAYDARKIIWIFVCISLFLTAVSGWFTKKITTNIGDYHNCTFDKKRCPSKQKTICAFSEVIIDVNSCRTQMTFWNAFKILFVNFSMAVIGLITAIATCLTFKK